MSWSVSMQKPLSIMSGMTEFNPEPKEEQSHFFESDPDVNCLPKSKINSEKINDIFSGTSRKNEWPLKSEVQSLDFRSSKKSVKNKTIEILPYVQVSLNSNRSPLASGQVKIIKGSYNKYQNQVVERKKLEGRQYSNKLGTNHSKFIHLNHTDSDFRHNESVIPYNIQISILAQNKEIIKCYEILLEIVQAGLVPDVYSYNPIIHALIKDGQPEEAWNLLNVMQNMGVRPDEVTYTVLLKSCLEMENLKYCGALLKEMQKVGIQPEEAIYNAVQNLYNYVLKVYLNNGDLKKGADLLAEMEKIVKFNRETYNILMQCYVNDGAIERVQALLHDMQADGFKPDYKTYHILIPFCEKNGDLEWVRALSEEMQKAGFKLAWLPTALKT